MKIDKKNEYLLKQLWHVSKSHGYLTRWENGKPILLHRIIMNPKDNEIVHHINGDKLDNRECNLICIERYIHQHTHLGKTNVQRDKRLNPETRRSYFIRMSYKGNDFRFGTFETKEFATTVIELIKEEIYGI